jgi:hypothetical protein
LAASTTDSTDETSEGSPIKTAVATAAKGSRPGLHHMMSQSAWPAALRAENTPARTNDDLPAPDGPITASVGRSFSLPMNCEISSSRPKNRLASFSVKGARPG